MLSLLAGGITGLYTLRIQLPWEYHVQVETGILKAKLGDLYSRWVGTRELLLYRHNPYGEQTSHAIQMAFYGHIVTPNDQSNSPELDEQRFAYPVYVVFLLAPTLYGTFSDAQRWVWLILALLTATSVLFGLRALRWNPPRTVVVATIVFVLSSPQIMQGLQLRQLGLLVGFLLMLATWCITRNRLGLAGAGLAVSTIKPQMMVFALLWFLVWTIGDWRRRWRLLASFAVTLAILVGAGEIVLPGWLRFFFEGLIAYRRYNHPMSLLDVMLGDRAGSIGAGLMMLCLFLFAWQNRKHAGDSREFVTTLSLVLIGTSLSMSLIPIFNQVLLLLPVIILLRDWASLPRATRLIFITLVIWPWFASLILLLWFSPHSAALGHLYLTPSYVSLTMPFLLPALLLRRKPLPSQQ